MTGRSGDFLAGAVMKSPRAVSGSINVIRCLHILKLHNYTTPTTTSTTVFLLVPDIFICSANQAASWTVLPR